MHNRNQGQAASQHYDDNGRVKFRKLSDLAQFFKLFYFTIDKIEDIFGFFKRLIGFGADKFFLQGWLQLANFLSFFREGKPTSPGIKIFNDFFERLIGNLSPLSIFITAFQGLLHIGKTIYVLGLSKDSPYTRTVQFGMGLVALGLIAVSIAIFAGAFTVAAPILFAAGAGRGIIEHALIGIGFIYERFFSTRSIVLNDRKAVLTKKYIEDKSHFTREDIQELLKISTEQREGNEKILNKVQGTWLSTGFLISALLMLSPVTAPAGTIMLISLTAFAIADAFLGLATKQNTTRWVARGLNAFAGLFMKQPPFNLEVKTEKDIRLELQLAEIAANKKKSSERANEQREQFAMQKDGRAQMIKGRDLIGRVQEARQEKEKEKENDNRPMTRKGKEKAYVKGSHAHLSLSFNDAKGSTSSPATTREKNTHEEMTHGSDTPKIETPASVKTARRALTFSEPTLKHSQDNPSQQPYSLYYSPPMVKQPILEDEFATIPSLQGQI